ncbi:MAG: prepilin-type N-terminal cleavage/methylation domain-containing protein [Planctomycetota bacterium]
MAHAPTSSSDHSQPATRRAFTLVELLVVLAVIGLALVIAVPAFTSITEGRKESASQNLISAALSRARAEAIKLGQPAGVFFYYDTVNERSKLAIVTLEVDLTDPNPYDEYKGFLADATRYDYQGSNPDPLGTALRGEPGMSADRVIAFASDTQPAAGFTGYDDIVNGVSFADVFGDRPRPVVLAWRRTTETLDGSADTAGGPPPGTIGTVTYPTYATYPDYEGTNGGTPDLFGNLAIVEANPNPANTTQLDERFEFNAGATQPEAWRLFSEPTLERIEQIDPIELPSGIGVQLITGVGLDTDVGSAGADEGGGFRERYVRAGAILFSPQGRLLRVDYGVLSTNSLGQLLDLAGNGVGRLDLVSQVGVVTYAEEAFEGAQGDGTALEWSGTAGLSEVDGNVIANFDTTQGDFNFFYPTRNDDSEDEYAEERWLDANTAPLLVNRFSGQLSRSE